MSENAGAEPWVVTPERRAQITRELIENLDRANPPEISINQVVAYNLARIRNLKGLTQAQAVRLLEPYLGVRWSTQRYSTAERAYRGEVRRDFSVNELFAFAQAFGVPMVEFFVRPDRALGIYSGQVGKAHRVEADRLPRIVGGPETVANEVAARLRTMASELEGHR